MKPIQLANDVYWVGAIDWGLRNFHGYLTQRGSTYNAYLILDEKITLIDSVKYYLYDEMMERISALIDPGKIDYVVSNHVEMDHSGGLPRLLQMNDRIKIITSPNGEKGLRAHYKKDWDFHVVNNGDTLKIGKRNLQFILTRMVHWPDNMVCYSEQDRILFSNDAFGQHIATSERFDDEYPYSIVLEEAKKYYANIVLPYGAMVQKALDAVSCLDISTIAPSHGIVWREHVSEIVAEYYKWAGNKTTKRALIIYDTMWGSTEGIARAISSAFENKGYHISLLNLRHNHISDIMTEVLTAEYICVGSPTLNNNMLPTVASFLTYFHGLAPKNRIGLAFGSYGWGGQSVGQVEKVLKDCGFEVLEPIKLQYVPDEAELRDITRRLEQVIR
ncbi:MAG: FprA family A-type flavoprotein [Candidatus Zhuqueibacterota bacterium]